MAGPIGVIANPASGKDIRRLVAAASVFDNQEKSNIVRRAVLGAMAAGASEFVYMPDSHQIAAAAFAELRLEARAEAVRSPQTGSAIDTMRAATEMRDRGCSVVLVLGGDGTNRAVALGWRDAPVIAISTGTNNVFPQVVEATVAGSAGGLIATDQVSPEIASRQAKVVHVEMEGHAKELALIDAVLLDESYAGSRAIWSAASLRTLVLSRADPASVGLCALGGLLHPVPESRDRALLVEVGDGAISVRAPIAPGLYAEVPVAGVRELMLGDAVEVQGPGMLAFDGEREVRLRAGQSARMSVHRDGPRVIDVRRALNFASCRGAFRLEAHGGD